MPGSDASVWANEGTAFTFTGDDINFAENGDKAMYSSVTFTGDFTFEAIQKVNTTDWCNFGCYVISEDATFTGNSSGGMTSMTNSWWIRADGTIKYGSTSPDSLTASTTARIKFERVSGTIKVYKDDVLEHTYATGSSAEVRMVVGNGGTTQTPGLENFIYSDNNVTFTPHGTWI